MSSHDISECPDCGSTNLENTDIREDDLVCSDCGLSIELEENELDRENKAGEFTRDWSESDYNIVVVPEMQEPRRGKRLEVRATGDTITLQTSEHLSGEEGAGYAFRAEKVDNIFLEKDLSESTSNSSPFPPSADTAVIFETAPTKSGEVFWIYEIDEPNEFFTKCETDDEISDKLMSSDRSPDETVETYGYTLVLDRPEDPSPDNTREPPQQAITIEVIRNNGQTYEFYDIDDPTETFGDSWGNTPEMFESIVQQNIKPQLSYENVSMRFQRPYGSL